MQHVVGEIVEGKVTGITKFGAFVELEGGAVGMVHISEVSQTYVNDISEHLKDQQQVKVKILNIGEDGKISLSIKKAMPVQQTQRRENNPSNFNNKPAFTPRPQGNSPRSQGSAPRGGNRPSGGFNNRPNHQARPATFEDMLSKFIQSSDEKISDLKRDKPTRRSNSGKRNKDYD